MRRRAKADMDAGHAPGEDAGSKDYERYPSEWYAELFAFMSVVAPDEAARADYGGRARTLLMHVIDRPLPGVGSEGEAVPRPAVRHVQPVTLVWGRVRADRRLGVRRTSPPRTRRRSARCSCAGRANCSPPTRPMVGGGGAADFHPEGPFNDPAMLTDKAQMRWAMNNYFTAHMRNLGYLAMALDEADDPDGKLRGYLRNATGQWLFMTDAAQHGDAAGGMSPEGSEYSVSSLAYIAQFLLALHTAGQDDPASWGPQVVADQPFWTALPLRRAARHPTPQHHRRRARTASSTRSSSPPTTATCSPTRPPTWSTPWLRSPSCPTSAATTPPSTSPAGTPATSPRMARSRCSNAPVARPTRSSPRSSTSCCSTRPRPHRPIPGRTCRSPTWRPG